MELPTQISTTPMEWRVRMQVISRARPVEHVLQNIDQTILFVREKLKAASKKKGRGVSQASGNKRRALVDGR